MSLYKIFLSAIYLCTWASLISLTPAFASDNFYLGGIQVNEPDHSKWINSLKESKFNTVAVTSYAHQGDWNSDNLWFSEPEENVIDEIRKAKKAGLKAVLILRVAIDHAFPKNAFIWHGMIMPNTDEKLKSWFHKYEKFVSKWAKIAEQESVDILGIGSEMNSMTSTIPITKIPGLEEFYLDNLKLKKRRKNVLEEVKTAEKIKQKPGSLRYVLTEFEKDSLAKKNWAKEVSFYDGENNETSINNRIKKINARRKILKTHWLSIIKSARKQFKGKLTYAANFDQYFKVDFWDSLDVMGVNAYFPLREHFVEDKALFNSLKKGWSKNLEEIATLKKSFEDKNKPLIFTELGFRYRKNSTIQPWAMDGFDMIKKEPIQKDSAPEEKKLIFWAEEPVYFKERTLALKALREASQEIQKKHSLPSAFLNGILYWKLSSIPSHLEIEPFVHILGHKKDSDFEQELRSFLIQ